MHGIDISQYIIQLLVQLVFHFYLEYNRDILIMLNFETVMGGGVQSSKVRILNWP